MSFVLELDLPKISGPLDERQVRGIMGPNFFGQDEWHRYFGLKLTADQQEMVRRIPWSKEFLTRRCSFFSRSLILYTHFMFLGASELDSERLTIEKWQKNLPDIFFSGNLWPGNTHFMKAETCCWQWYLMLKFVVPGSADKDWECMRDMLPKEYEPSTPIGEITKNILFFTKNGMYLNPYRYAACISKTSPRTISMIGAFNPRINILPWSGFSLPNFGLSATRRFGQ